jgi:hypothetical protein
LKPSQLARSFYLSPLLNLLNSLHPLLLIINLYVRALITRDFRGDHLKPWLAFVGLLIVLLLLLLLPALLHLLLLWSALLVILNNTLRRCGILWCRPCLLNLLLWLCCSIKDSSRGFGCPQAVTLPAAKDKDEHQDDECRPRVENGINYVHVDRRAR